MVDTSVLVGELLRAAGRERLGTDQLELFWPEHTSSEVERELPRRLSAFARQRGTTRAAADELAQLCLATLAANVSVIDEAVYAALDDEARARSVRDQDDWPLVACALALSAGIWTTDKDLLGTGVPTWTTESLRVWLQRNPTAG